MLRFEAISAWDAHPGKLLAAVWEVVLTDVEGCSPTEARRRHLDVSPSEYAIADDQWWALFDLVRATGTGDPAVDLELDDLWIARSPNTYR
jgi:hypothetical protein